MLVDYIIVGQGLAGSILADHLMSEGCDVIVYDDPDLSNSSKIAAGLYNPVTGRKMVKTWNAKPLFDYLIDYYPQFEQRLSSNFLHDIPIYRPFISPEELNEWMGKSADVDYSQFIRKVQREGSYGHQVCDDFGGLLLNQSGYVNTGALLVAAKAYLKSKSVLKSEVFNSFNLSFEGDSVRYGDIVAKAVIYCNGHKSVGEQFFSWVPLRPVKGELLIIKTDEPLEVIYNRGVFVIPLGEGLCKVGSTYNHNNLDEKPTLEAKNVLIKKLDDLVRFSYEVESQLAGIRPATKDRKPIIGAHHKHQNLYSFNGFGAKGVSLIPLYAKEMTQLLINDKRIDSEVNIERFFSLT